MKCNFKIESIEEPLKNYAFIGIWYKLVYLYLLDLFKEFEKVAIMRLFYQAFRGFY